MTNNTQNVTAEWTINETVLLSFKNYNFQYPISKKEAQLLIVALGKILEENTPTAVEKL